MTQSTTTPTEQQGLTTDPQIKQVGLEVQPWVYLIPKPGQFFTCGPFYFGLVLRKLLFSYPKKTH